MEIDMSKHGQNHNEQNPLDTMERNDTRTPQEVLESAEAVKGRLQHSEVEGLVEFRAKKQELKNWLYGTVYKGYDQEEEAETVQQDVEDHFTDEWFINLITTHGAKERERIIQVLENLPCHRHGGVLPDGKIPAAILVEDIMAALPQTDVTK